MTQLSPPVGWYYGSKDGLYYKYYNFENGSYVSWETKYVSLNLFLFIYIFKTTFSIFYFFLLCFRLSVTFNFQADKSNANKVIVIVRDDSVRNFLPKCTFSYEYKWCYVWRCSIWRFCSKRSNRQVRWCRDFFSVKR